MDNKQHKHLVRNEINRERLRIIVGLLADVAQDAAIMTEHEKRTIASDLDCDMLLR